MTNTERAAKAAEVIAAFNAAMTLEEEDAVLNGVNVVYEPYPCGRECCGESRYLIIEGERFPF